MSLIKKGVLWFAAQYMQDYRESRARVLDVIIQNNLHLNTVILTVSIASLTAVAALNDRVFVHHPQLSIMVIGLFVLVVLLSTINFYLSSLVLGDLQRNLNKDVLFPLHASKGQYKPKYQMIQRSLSVFVLGGFCLGLMTLLVLLSLYIMGIHS